MKKFISLLTFMFMFLLTVSAQTPNKVGKVKTPQPNKVAKAKTPSQGFVATGTTNTQTPSTATPPILFQTLPTAYPTNQNFLVGDENNKTKKMPYQLLRDSIAKYANALGGKVNIKSSADFTVKGNGRDTAYTIQFKPKTLDSIPFNLAFYNQEVPFDTIGFNPLTMDYVGFWGLDDEGNYVEFPPQIYWEGKSFTFGNTSATHDAYFLYRFKQNFVTSVNGQKGDVIYKPTIADVLTNGRETNGSLSVGSLIASGKRSKTLNNTVIGASCEEDGTLGELNIGIGVSVFQHISGTPKENTAIGAQSYIFPKDTGNTAIGAQALLGLRNGSKNIGIGYRAGWASLDPQNAEWGGDNNVFIGNDLKTPMMPIGRQRICNNQLNINDWIKGDNGIISIPKTPIYVNNAAAKTAGKQNGTIYHNGDGILRIVF